MRKGESIVTSSATRFLLLQVGLVTLFSCSSPYPEPIHPEDNPFSIEKAELGEKLFFDPRLSIDNTVSCATCHVPERAFTDNLPLSNGVYGRKSLRNAPSLINVAYQPHFMFEGEIKTLEMQAVVPITDLNEMGYEKIGELVQKLHSIDEYNELAKQVFDREFDVWVLTRALAAYERTLIVWNSPFDDYYFLGKELDKQALKGYRIFDEQLHCTDCHPAPFFTSFEIKSNGSGNGRDGGRYRITADSTDFGKFKIPSLRNVTKTYPYMHDGSVQTIDEVLDYYAKGGSGNLNQSEEIKSFTLSDEEREALHAFFRSLETN
ncbi:cytochrome c peroxidase [Wandonia haliotis]|uniref:Cytochrome c peroxidase n=1 Tax=Wandonia haliotis TaxID=574963 RepID=A0ABP3Y5G8_9FLAO